MYFKLFYPFKPSLAPAPSKYLWASGGGRDMAPPCQPARLRPGPPAAPRTEKGPPGGPFRAPGGPKTALRGPFGRFRGPPGRAGGARAAGARDDDI
eukprot:scaffold614_cov367-Prasinococcus_capsulatus_cf.AAC.32